MSEIVLEDGTPIADVLDELKELKADVLQLKRALRAITNLCNAPYWTPSRRWDIERIASDARKGKFERVNAEVKP